MTSLAFDGRYIAIDSQITGGGTRFEGHKTYDILTPDGERLVCFGVGNLGEWQRAVQALAAGDDPPKGEYALLVWCPVVGLYEYEGGPDFSQVDYRYASGTGAQACLAAMKMGASAVRAVEIAAEVDVYTSLPVVVFDTQTGKFRKARTRKTSPKGD
jgi:hypothetical protein